MLAIKVKQKDISFSFFVCDRVPLYYSGCPGNHFVDHTGLEDTEINLLLPHKYWDKRHAPSLPGQKYILNKSSNISYSKYGI